MSAHAPLSADKRVPFLDDDGATWVFVGFNWSAATYLMHIRNKPGDTGDPLMALASATAGTQGISATYDPAYVYVDGDGETITSPATKILLQIDEATIEALSLGTPYDEPLELNYDLHCTPAGLAKRVIARGEFFIKPGVTI